MNLELLKELVDIDSRSSNIDGVNQIQMILSKILTSLGFDVKFVTEGQDNQDKTRILLWAQKKGKSTRAISLVCHADTVLGPTSDFHFKIDYQRGRIIGPGVGDNKGGIVLLIGSLKDFLEKHNEHFYTLNFICSPSEELGSIGFHHFFAGRGIESDYVFGFEPALSNGDIINERAGNRWYDILIKGKSGHAGRWNEATINAAHIASNVISQLHTLSDFDEKRRINIASLNGGSDRHNVVCGEMQIKLDARFKNFKSRTFLHDSLCRLLDETKISDVVNQLDSSFEFSILDDCPPMGSSYLSQDFAIGVIEKIKKIEGRKVSASYSGGAADINYFQREGLISLDGLGPIASKMHTTEEYIEIDSLFSRRYVFTEILAELNEEKYITNEELDGISVIER